MNIEALAAEVARDNEPVPFFLLDPLNAPYTSADGAPVIVRVLGLQSKARRLAENAEYNRHHSSGADNARARRVRLAAACVVDLIGLEAGDGSPIPFSPGAAQALLSTDDQILAQVETAIENHARIRCALAENAAAESTSTGVAE